MATLKNAQVPGALSALNGLLGEKLPVRAALKVRRMHRTLTQAWEDVEAVRAALLEEHAERDAEGNKLAGEPLNGEPTIKILEANRDEFNQQWLELMNAEVTVSDVLVVDELGAGTEIRPSVLIGLGDLLAD